MPAGLKQQQLLVGRREVKDTENHYQGSHCSNQINQQQKALLDCKLSSKHRPSSDEHAQTDAVAWSTCSFISWHTFSDKPASGHTQHPLAQVRIVALKGCWKAPEASTPHSSLLIVTRVKRSHPSRPDAGQLHKVQLWHHLCLARIPTW